MTSDAPVARMNGGTTVAGGRFCTPEGDFPCASGCLRRVPRRSLFRLRRSPTRAAMAAATAATRRSRPRTKAAAKPRPTAAATTPRATASRRWSPAARAMAATRRAATTAPSRSGSRRPARPIVTKIATWPKPSIRAATATASGSSTSTATVSSRAGVSAALPAASPTAARQDWRRRTMAACPRARLKNWLAPSCRPPSGRTRSAAPIATGTATTTASSTGWAATASSIGSTALTA